MFIHTGIVDPKRIALLGNSAGGARAYLLLSRYRHTFAAGVLNEAVSPDPVSLVIGLVSGTNAGAFPAGIFRSALGADLSEAPERYKANYMFDAAAIEAPTLIMMGNEERGGVDHFPYEVIFSILRYNGIPTRMLSFMDEGHGYAHPAAAQIAFEEARSWFDAYVLDQPRGK